MSVFAPGMGHCTICAGTNRTGRWVEMGSDMRAKVCLEIILAFEVHTLNPKPYPLTGSRVWSFV